MSDLHVPDLSAGYVHDGQVVYALQFDLEAEAGQSRNLIVWLTSDGHSVASWIQPAATERHIVTTKVGEHIKVRDKLEKVIGVSMLVFRAIFLLTASDGNGRSVSTVLSDAADVRGTGGLLF